MTSGAMKGLGANRSRHLSESCDLSDCSPGPLYSTGTLPRSPYLLSPTMDHYGTMDPHHFVSPNPGTLPPECLLPLSNQISNSSTFPRIHYNSHFDQADFSPVSMPAGDSIGGIGTGTLGGPMSMGMSPTITSSSAVISPSGKMNRLPANLLDQFEKQLPAHRDGFSTLQFHRSGASKQRGDSPGRIRYLVNSVQKLFAKSQSLEVSGKGHTNGRFSAGSGGSAGDSKHARRSKSKERPPKAEPPKRRPRSNMSGYWSSDDLDSDTSNYRSPMMSLDQSTVDGQASKYFMNSYNTIDKHTLKGSKSNNNLKNQACLAISAPGGGPPRAISSGLDADFLKGGSWSTLTLSQARQMCQRGSATIDRAMLTKSKSCTQDLTCHYLQVPPEDWNSTLGRGSSSGEIPCRRMRSGSYVKAMGDLEDSDDSESSPKPSPKMAARRQSYLKATQHSLSDQLPSRKAWGCTMLHGDLEPMWSPMQSVSSLHQLGSCLPSLRELSTNRSLDNLDCFGGPTGSPFLQWDDEDFSRTCSTLGKSSCHSQVRELEVSHRYEETCSESVFGESDSQAVEALDLPLPPSFRSRSHSYLRAIQAGCSQDDDTASLDSDSPPPTATTVRTYSTSTMSTCITTCKKAAPPPVPPRTTSKPFVSVTVQSSTESAQDTYLDSQDHKSEANSQSGRSNSSDSLSSGTRAGGAPKGAQVQLPLASCRDARSLRSPPEEPKHVALTVDEPRANPVPRRKLSSIGIQVDCALPAQREETPPLSKFQSIGVQVEDSWQLSRSSSMASKPETDSDTQEIIVPKPAIKNLVNSACQSTDSPGRHKQADADGDASGALRQLSGRITTQSGSTSFSESLDPALDPSSLPPPDPWLESGNNSSPGGPPQPNVPACRRDGHWFLKLLQAETARMEGWCQQMEQETKDHQLSEEVLGKIRSAVGSAQLLMSQKFQQFRGLCQQNLNVNANPRPTAQDLAGFWDLLQLSIEDISMKFDELYHLKSNDWQPADSADKKEDKKQPPPVPKKPVKARPATAKEKATDAADKQRQEARKRLMAAKRAASGRQNSATESADSIEIYVPEAQTRL
ncbi:disks large-associated protein 4-like isoform X2 [Brienomyrus brachyistius]|uniref:disks large-associated protein 4-like isoform X2 n=1 Tax=Brienomyrus brachyistius TaxID=42636 RepID=UPI0020B204E2|nr:disks large-associated protein 4-like isoform X2 [Brienomyrus brachyistius]